MNQPNVDKCIIHKCNRYTMSKWQKHEVNIENAGYTGMKEIIVLSSYTAVCILKKTALMH